MHLRSCCLDGLLLLCTEVEASQAVLLQKEDGMDLGKLCKEGDFKLGDWLGEGEASPADYLKSKGVQEAALA